MNKIKDLLMSAKTVIRTLHIRKLYKEILKVSKFNDAGWTEEECYNIACHIFCGTNMVDRCTISAKNHLEHYFLKAMLDGIDLEEA